jgi:hypothetical protein
MFMGERIVSVEPRVSIGSTYAKYASRNFVIMLFAETLSCLNPAAQENNIHKRGHWFA